MTIVSIVEAQSKLSEIIHQLNPGEGVIIKENDLPIARLLVTQPQPRQPRRPGILRGTRFEKISFPAQKSGSYQPNTPVWGVRLIRLITSYVLKASAHTGLLRVNSCYVNLL